MPLLVLLQVAAAGPLPEAELVVQSGHTSINEVAISRDGRRLITAANGDVAKVWAVDSGMEALTYRAHGRGVRRVELSADGQLAASNGLDFAVRVWRPTTGETLFESSGSVGASAVTLHPTRPLVAIRRTLDQVEVVDFTSKRTVARMKGPTSAALFSPDGSRLALLGLEGLRFYDTGRFALLAEHPEVRASSDISAILAFDGTGARVAVGSSAGVAVYGVQPFTPVARPVIADFAKAAALDSTGTRLAVSYFNSDLGKPNLWTVDLYSLDKPAPKPVQKLRGHQDRVGGLAFVPGGERLATASEDGTAIIWDVTTGEVLKRLEGRAHRVHGVTFVPGTDLVATAHGSSLRLWSWVSGELKHVVQEPAKSVVASSELIVIAAPKEKQVRLLGAVDGQVLGQVKLPAPIKAENGLLSTLALSPRGDLLGVNLTGLQVRGCAAAASAKSRAAPKPAPWADGRPSS